MTYSGSINAKLDFASCPGEVFGFKILSPCSQMQKPSALQKF